MDRYATGMTNAARIAAQQALSTKFNPTTSKNSFDSSFNKLFGAGVSGNAAAKFAQTNTAKSTAMNAAGNALSSASSGAKIKASLNSISQRLSQGIGTPVSGGGIGSSINYQQGYHATNLISDLMAAQQSGSTNNPSSLYTGSGNVGLVGSDPNFGQFASSPGVDQEIQDAATQFGVPVNFLKSIIAAESSGDWAGNNRYAYLRNDTLLPYIGVFKAAADSRGLSDLWNQAAGNRAVQIKLLAGVLRSQYDEIRQQNSAYNWLNVASYHYSGRPVPDGWQDEGGNGTNNDYMNKIANWWQQLDSYAGNTYDPNGSSISAGGSTGAPTSSTGWNSIWGGMDEPVSQEFGPTDWSMGAGSYMYGYGASYGVQGHPGVDVGIPAGTKLYSPVGGTVVYSGGTGYYTYYGNGGPGVGEFLVQLDNGDQLILGHMSQITAQVGQRVNAGDYIGLSGGENGDHVHVEYRQKTPGATDSGYTAVDPRKVLSSAGGGALAASQNAGQNAMNALTGTSNTAGYQRTGSVFSQSYAPTQRAASVFGRW